jgi:NitT/TauT family transport system ATP-binding protein
MDWKKLTISGVCKRFERGPLILKDVSLTVERGAFLCILGPSGSGKSTLLELIAAFEQPTHGTISYDGQTITKPGPDRVVIFQDISNALFPWLTVAENVEFGLKSSKRSKAERRKMAVDALALVGLATDLDKFPSELSGGMKQRAQIARGLVLDPQILLMDEPFAALDAITRRRMQYELKQLWQRTGKTVVFITHDIDEALILATDIAVLSPGPAAHVLEDYKPNLPKDARPEDPAFVAAYRHVEQLIDRDGAHAGEGTASDAADQR